MSTPVHGRKWAHEDLLALPEDLFRHEILDGEHVLTAAPNESHQDAVLNLAAMLREHVRRTQCGKVLVAPFDVVLSKFDVVEPDILYVSNERKHILTGANAQGAPDLVIEVLSPSTRGRDQRQKRDRYGRLGVGEYWMVDPAARTVEVVRWAEETSEIVLQAEDTLATPLMPGLAVPLSSIWGD